MFETILQIWGGLFYLLNKIFFSRVERNEGNRKRIWRIWAWIVYLVGLPAWVIIFIFERNWIAASVEAGGAPAMFLGLVIALRGKDKEPKWLDLIAVVAITIGFAVSLFDFGGITTFEQVLEIGIVTGFLIGTYLLAKKKPTGYLWFVLMNISCGWLMFWQNYLMLALQQGLSLVFVVDAYLVQKRKKKIKEVPT